MNTDPGFSGGKAAGGAPPNIPFRRNVSKGFKHAIKADEFERVCTNLDRYDHMIDDAGEVFLKGAKLAFKIVGHLFIAAAILIILWLVFRHFWTTLGAVIPGRGQ